MSLLKMILAVNKLKMLKIIDLSHDPSFDLYPNLSHVTLGGCSVSGV